ncbi:asparagine synthase [Thalassotalea sp. M1531]|uniref:asparagine synthase (glutamine-hydrolyzing) n=2 Tax=Thalassotalea algicola TaxID=2716224 RepID=A0A7Y0LEH7_9GAMM|nr:asparagine synthase [Thalassotalea algicola]
MMGSTASVQHFTIERQDCAPVYVASKAQYQHYEDEALAVFVWGRLLVDNESANAQQLADKIKQSASLDSLYSSFSGKFCIACFDQSSQSLAVVNDHMSIQPFFYSQQSTGLYLSDSLDLIEGNKATVCTISKQGIYNYFYFHCIPAPLTIYQECKKLEPACRLTFVADKTPVKQNLYNPEFSKTLADGGQAEAECLDVIAQGVEQCSTQNCGAFLSGGLDSSTVAGMLANQQENAKTFSIGFKVDAYDETPYAEITAKHFNTDHQVLYLTPEDAVEGFTNVAQYFEEPFGNSSAMAAYFCAKFAKENGVDTLLAGDGGDELFAGNGRYAKQKVFEVFAQTPSLVQSVARGVFVNDFIGKLPVAKKVASYISQADVPLPGRLETYNFINQFGADNMFDETFLQEVDTQAPLMQQQDRYKECRDDDSVHKMLYLDWKFTLADNDLVKVSKMCEMAGVNVEYPLLEKSVVDFSCTIPSEVKLPGSKLRDFYKRACKGFLADDTLTKSKHGFGLPFGVWMKENEQLKTLTMDCLNAFKTRNIVKPSLIDQALESHQSVHAGYYGELIWIMVILELWFQGKDIQEQPVGGEEQVDVA